MVYCEWSLLFPSKNRSIKGKHFTYKIENARERCSKLISHVQTSTLAKRVCPVGERIVALMNTQLGDVKTFRVHSEALPWFFSLLTCLKNIHGERYHRLYSNRFQAEFFDRAKYWEEKLKNWKGTPVSSIVNPKEVNIYAIIVRLEKYSRFFSNHYREIKHFLGIFLFCSVRSFNPKTTS